MNWCLKNISNTNYSAINYPIESAAYKRFLPPYPLYKILKYQYLSQKTQLFVVMVMLAFCSTACSEYQPYSYGKYTQRIRSQVNRVCDAVSITHFVVDDQAVYLKIKNSPDNISLRHYKPNMPNGYYYCLKQKNTTLLE